MNASTDDTGTDRRLNVLITGGAGFIGSHLADMHLQKGDSVTIVDNLSTGSLRNIAGFRQHPDLQFHKADILYWEGIDDAMHWADRVYHMAAVVGVKKVLSDPRVVMATNIAGTERIFRVASLANPDIEMIIPSSSEVYGFSGKPFFSESDDIVLRPLDHHRWIYAVSKLADEYLAMAYRKHSAAKVVVVRLFNTVGPNQTGRYGMVVPTFISQAVAGEPLTIYGNGHQTRSFCDVRDTVVALDRLACNPQAQGEIVNVGSDAERSIRELAELIVERAGSSSPLRFISYADAYGEHFEDHMHRRPDIRKLHSLTGFWHHWQFNDTLDDLILRERERRAVQDHTVGVDG
ncbi:MAG TPA: nucleoside-diphosphate sugar epimerase [Chlorobium sp.]|uniref:NAD-dependent epimerase/dehydratase n=1 Tax=Chlorobium phaeovibrioides (strain DSM 265 / 1930) TaxID=290318 RepID=A4SFN8_CHLPM|nr:nucleoside-diphosphate sugar epimerase [Chlorobium sp.]